jgi:peptidoglycan hydrolase-like protein with peptidoglycan-binding domain
MAEAERSLSLLEEPDLEGVREWGRVPRRGPRQRESVTLVQETLRRLGLALSADGRFGSVTELAVKRFQVLERAERRRGGG